MINTVAAVAAELSPSRCNHTIPATVTNPVSILVMSGLATADSASRHQPVYLALAFKRIGRQNSFRGFPQTALPVRQYRICRHRI